MDLRQFAQLVISKTSGHRDVEIDGIFAQRVDSALVKIAKATTPLKLIVHKSGNRRILRRVDRETYIVYPTKVKVTEETEIDIDDDLLDAAALLVIAGLEPQKANLYIGLYYAELNAFNDNLSRNYEDSEYKATPLQRIFP